VCCDGLHGRRADDRPEWDAHEPLHRSKVMSSAILLAICLVFAAGPRATAQVQGGGATAVALSAKHELLGNPLVGGGVELWIPAGDGRFAFRFGGEWLHGQADRIGIPCAGLVEPGTCAPEPVHDRSRMTTARGGGMLRLAGGHNATLKLTADWMVTRVSVDTHGNASGSELTAAKMLWGAWLGVSADWIPWSHVPIGLEMEAGLGDLIPILNEHILDGYAPFDGGMSVRHLRLGLVWRPRFPRQR